MIRACLLLIAGGFAAQHSRVPLSSDLCKLSIVASLALLIFPRTRIPGLLLLGFSLFMSAGMAVVEKRVDERFEGDSLLTQVRVVDFPTTNGLSVVMLVEPIDDRRIPPLSRVSWYEPPVKPAVGDIWELELRIRRPRGSSNRGVFDYEAWLFRQKIQAVGYVVSGKRNRLLEGDAGGPVEKLRERFVARALETASSQEQAAVLAAVGVGARHLVSRQQWDRYAVTGTSHLMAISGLHVGLAASSAFIVAILVFGALRVVRTPYIAALALGVVLAVAYAYLSGFGVPARRAALMLVIAALTVIRRRQLDAPAILATAGVIVFVLDPIATMTPGFNLSFSAVALLLWLARRKALLASSSGPFVRTWNKLQQLVVMQVFLLFGLMPLTVLIFRRVAWLATPANLVGVPMFSIVTVPFTLAGLALGGVSEAAGRAALGVALLGIGWLEQLISIIARTPYADTTIPDIDGFGWALVFMPALWVLLPKGWPGRHLAILSVAALFCYTPEPPPLGCADIHVLDVGQGLATVVQTRDSVLVYDTGVSFRGGGSVAEQVIVPFLKSRGIRRVDWMVVSHADIDHSGGAATLLALTEVAAVFVGEWLPDTVPAAVRCNDGQRWHADGVNFRFLYPGVGKERAGNDASCVLSVRAGRHVLLLTGDIEVAAEHELIQQKALTKADVVVVPHHGSLTSSSAPFVAVASPEVAIVSAGYANRWGFPAERVTGRWAAAGAEVLNTATAGAVSFRLCADGGIRQLRSDRFARRRFWRTGR